MIYVNILVGQNIAWAQKSLVVRVGLSDHLFSEIPAKQNFVGQSGDSKLTIVFSFDILEISEYIKVLASYNHFTETKILFRNRNISLKLTI